MRSSLAEARRLSRARTAASPRLLNTAPAVRPLTRRSQRPRHRRRRRWPAGAVRAQGRPREARHTAPRKRWTPRARGRRTAPPRAGGMRLKAILKSQSRACRRRRGAALQRQSAARSAVVAPLHAVARTATPPPVPLPRARPPHAMPRRLLPRRRVQPHRRHAAAAQRLAGRRRGSRSRLQRTRPRAGLDPVRARACLIQRGSHARRPRCPISTRHHRMRPL